VLSFKNDYNLKLKLNVNFTITKNNYKDIYDYLKLLVPFKGINSVVFNVLMCSGNAKKHFKQIFVTYSEIAKEMKKAVNRTKRNNKGAYLPIQLFPMSYCMMVGYEEYVGKSEVPMQIKNKKAEVLPRGNNQVKGRKC